MKRLQVLTLAVALVLIIWGGLFSNTASSQQIESRLNNLQADFNRLESQFNQLESQIYRNRPPSSTRTTLTPRQSTGRGNLSQAQRDQMFDRLATLVVELKQQVNTLEKRIAKLEAR